METIGSLVDKLIVVNLKIWAFEDIKRMSSIDSEIANATRKTNILNQQRADIIQEIDELVVGLVNKTAQMKLYKGGETKTYGKH